MRGLRLSAPPCDERFKRPAAPDMPCPPPPHPRRAWLPLSEAVLSMAAEHLPSPLDAAPERCARLLPPRAEALRGADLPPALVESLDASEAAVKSCSADPQGPLVLYVSKMVAVPAAALPRCVNGWVHSAVGRRRRLLSAACRARPSCLPVH